VIEPNVPPVAVEPECPACGKPARLCVCEAIDPVVQPVEVLILRHPQEQDRVLGSAPIAIKQLAGATLRTGLSWPNLGRALGREADPKRWGVLYLGTASSAAKSAQAPSPSARALVVVDSEGEPLERQDEILGSLKGLILLDGNWQQAKALWWRNAWMLKCRRLVLTPPRPSHYGALRKEPRRESVSTIEAAAYALADLNRDPQLAARILPPFHLLLEKVRAAGPDVLPKQRKPDFRGRSRTRRVNKAR
jgi:DTW domain-containing protein